MEKSRPRALSVPVLDWGFCALKKVINLIFHLLEALLIAFIVAYIFNNFSDLLGVSTQDRLECPQQRSEMLRNPQQAPRIDLSE